MGGTKEPAGTEPLDAEDEKFGSANKQSKPEVPPKVNTPSQHAFSLENTDRNGWNPLTNERQLTGCNTPNQLRQGPTTPVGVRLKVSYGRLEFRCGTFKTQSSTRHLGWE